MILFVPLYDEATRYNHALIRWFPEGTDIVLAATLASRVHLAAAASGHGEHVLLALSHGDAETLKGQDGERTLAVGDVSIVADWSVIAIACLTANRLGVAAAAAGVVWWGYTGRINAPEHSSDRVGSLLAGVVVVLIERIRRGLDEANVDDALDAVRLAAEMAGDELSTTDDGEEDVFGAFCFLNHVWQRARVSLPGSSEWTKSRFAPNPLVID